VLTDNRLFAYSFDARDIGLFGWRAVVYLASFVVVYLAVRRGANVNRAILKPVSSPLIAAILILAVAAYLFKWFIKLRYGVDPGTSYSNMSELMQGVAEMPLFLLQLSTIVFAALLLLKQALVLIFIQRWRRLSWRVILILALIIEVVTVAVRMGSRGDAVLLMISFILLYDRFVRPMRLKWLIAAVGLIIAGFLVQGQLRGAFAVREITWSNPITTSNEFQNLFATAYDLYHRKEMGKLGVIPWQIYASDLYIVIPQQFLPFEKIDPSVWYLQVLRVAGTGTGFMFGVMSQAVLGFDWIELVARGAVLGLIFAALHRWYVRRASDFWPTLFYLMMSIWTFYTYRATTFWFVHFIVYQFIPIIMAAKVLEYAFTTWHGLRIRE